MFDFLVEGGYGVVGCVVGGVLVLVLEGVVDGLFSWVVSGWSLVRWIGS